MIHSVGIDRNRPTHAENIGRLHGLNSIFWMQHGLNGVPSGPTLHSDGLLRFVKFDLVERTHVQDYGVLVKRLAPHTVPHACDRHF